ncbi:VPLPA-CTERM sorting domain-containing protein [Pseudoruegeria sp. SK021]|uniref:VPLPA-CTERM sorting domain-containing protein n=1 Tax=Pseudoruegeria sp. SK021 TaxID=1933035 RepID=UPI000A251894|nr:VPLPA-CTERM sorting domain-containing protein [Pseudoruegeria sp. SK021]OSP55452.1 hypothetical protein BV911_07335 [Pseudoruegeria sp. SK021]
MIHFFTRVTAAAILALSVSNAASAASFLGEFWDVRGSVTSLSSAQRIVSRQAPTATFTSTAVDYFPGRTQSQSDFHTLTRFLGRDAASLSGAQNTRLMGSVFRFSGTLDLAAGTHSIAVGSDDGFGLSFNGASIASYSGLRNFGTTRTTFTSTGAPVDFDLVFFENTGLTGLEFRIDNTIVTDAMAYTTPVPLPAALPLLAGAMASLGLMRRRRTRSA